MIKIGIIGAAGRMGKEIISAVLNKSNKCTLSSIVVENVDQLRTIEHLIHDSNTTQTTSIEEAFENSDVVIEFTNPQTSVYCSELVKKFRTSLVSGTTGLSDHDYKVIKDNAIHGKILHSSNMSYGIEVMKKMIAIGASTLQGYDILLEDTHHKHKKDSPSGTAISLKEAMKGHVDVVSHRYGNIIGDHEVTFLEIKKLLKSHTVL